MRVTPITSSGATDRVPAPRTLKPAPHEKNHHARPAQPAPDETAQHLALAAHATNDAVRHWDVASGRLTWAHGLDRLFGYEHSPISREIGFWQRHVHPEDRAQVAASIRDALGRADHWTGEYRFRRADGDYLLVLERALIQRDQAGAPVAFIGSIMDITARKHLQDQLCRSQRMEAFGQLAGGVAHDFNNFLTTILGYSDLLLSDLPAKTPAAKHVTEIRGAARRASALTGQLLAFSRRHPLEPRVIEVNALLTNLERSFLRLLGESITVECHLHRAAQGAYLRVDPGQINQIILNLVVNARDAMPQGGRLCLSTGTLRIHDHAGHQSTDEDELPPGDYVSISVRDTGHGMTPEVKARLFEPFFTTKAGSQTSGLGLATSYGLVRQSGGQMRVESAVDCGTTVTIYLPRVAAPAYLERKRLGEYQPPRGSETVLVVEDDISVRHIAVRVLRSLGYRVIEAANGDDACRLVTEEKKRPIDLLLADIVMPHMSGHHFADWLLKDRPRTKVIFISGYLEESLQQFLPGGGSNFLPKPFDPHQLALKVRETLDGKIHA